MIFLSSLIEIVRRNVNIDFLMIRRSNNPPGTGWVERSLLTPHTKLWIVTTTFLVQGGFKTCSYQLAYRRATDFVTKLSFDDITLVCHYQC